MNQPFAAPKWESAGWTVTGWMLADPHDQPLRAIVFMLNRYGEQGRVPIWAQVSEESQVREAFERAFDGRDVSCDECGRPAAKAARAMTDITITLTESERRLAEFATWNLAREAWARTDAAAQDKAGRYFTIGDAAKFERDARAADALVGKLRAAQVMP